MLEKILKIPGVWPVVSFFLSIQILIRSYKKVAKSDPGRPFSYKLDAAFDDANATTLRLIRKVELDHWRKQEQK